MNKKTGFLVSAINKAVRDGVLQDNPLSGLGNLSDPRIQENRYLSRHEIDLVLDTLREDPSLQRLYRITLFLLNTGARRSEALRVRWSDVNFEEGYVTLHTTKQASRGRKAGVRHIPLNAALEELLKSMPRDSEHLFHYPNNLRRDFQKACVKAEIEPCKVHDLRHTFASHLAIAGIPLNTIRELLGHTEMTMTLRYAHLCPSVKGEAVSRLNFGVISEPEKVLSLGPKTG